MKAATLLGEEMNTSSLCGLTWSMVTQHDPKDGKRVAEMATYLQCSYPIWLKLLTLYISPTPYCRDSWGLTPGHRKSRRHGPVWVAVWSRFVLGNSVYEDSSPAICSFSGCVSMRGGVGLRRMRAGHIPWEKPHTLRAQRNRWNKAMCQQWSLYSATP